MHGVQRSFRQHRKPRGFTLIEVTVVVVVLAIMATMIVPRLVGNDKREFKLAVDQVGDLLTMYAQRESTGQKVVGISHNRQFNQLELWEIDTDNGGVTDGGSWRRDFYVQPVRLPQFMLDTDLEIVVDGDRVDASEWPVCGELGQQRPQISISLHGAEEIATLTLAPYAVAPTLSSTYGVSGVIREAVDLDGTGHSREDW
jgi:prepilin-type N-terminal cleavage/methylation domain-containing protein